MVLLAFLMMLTYQTVSDKELQLQIVLSEESDL